MVELGIIALATVGVLIGGALVRLLWVAMSAPLEIEEPTSSRVDIGSDGDGTWIVIDVEPMAEQAEPPAER